MGDGVWAWLQPGGGSGISNAAVVADDDGLTVVDCLMVRSQWGPFAAAVAGLGPPVRRLVLTHAHIDHVGGTKAFPLASILASPATSALLDQPLMTEGYKAFMPAFADEFDDLAELGTRPVTHEVTDGAPIGTRMELIPAAGHTAGDLMVLVDDSILFAGDVCFFGVTPLAFQGDPAAWVQVLELVPDLAATIVATAPSAARPRSRPCATTWPPAWPARSRPAPGTPGSNGTATRSTSNGPPCSPPGRTRRRCPPRCSASSAWARRARGPGRSRRSEGAPPRRRRPAEGRCRPRSSRRGPGRWRPRWPDRGQRRRRPRGCGPPRPG